MTIPIHHSLGDVGHTTDHNSISDVLQDHEADIGGLSSSVGGLQSSISSVQNQVNNLGSVYMSKSGNNNVTVSNPTGYEARVTIPAGTRDGNVFVHSTTYGGRATFELDSYGQIRQGSAIDTTCPVEIYGPNTQTEDLTRWRRGGITGGIVAKVDAFGNITAPNVTPGGWSNIPLDGAVSSNFGIPCQYRTIGDMVYLRGNIKRSNNANFTSSPQTVGTLPSGYRPPYTLYTAQGAFFGNNYLYVRMEIQSGGAIVFYFPSSVYQPTWVALDNISFSRTG